jgi:hypothetical protein
MGVGKLIAAKSPPAAATTAGSKSSSQEDTMARCGSATAQQFTGAFLA